MYYQKQKKPKTAEEDTCEKALQNALHILSFADCSEKKLYEKLILRGYSQKTAAQTVALLVQNGTLCEARQLEALSDYLANKMCYGARRIRTHLAQKGYAQKALDAIDWDAFDFVSICEKRIARTYVRLKKEDYKKVFAAMARNGFSSYEIKEAFTNRLKETED